MKLKTLLISFAVAASSAVFAHGTIIDQTADAILAASDKFYTEEANSVDRFAGISGVPGENETVKVVVTLKDATTVAYSCYEHEMDGRETWMCDQTQE
ncbi:MAG: hypothetical protein ABIR96_08560 [Bdellovibrionota bacterium]